MQGFLRALFTRAGADNAAVSRINDIRARLKGTSDGELRSRCHESDDVNEVIAVVAITAERVLGLRMFDVQLQGALALAAGEIAEMQTGEGKTLAAVPAIVWMAKAGAGVHVMTVNDYLSRRDARWMSGIYESLGFTVGCVQQSQTVAERQAAYNRDVTYATANEVGFDFLRGQLALRPEDRVHRPFNAALIDEADSILIDEARIPLVIAGGDPESGVLAERADRIARALRFGYDFTIEQNHRNVALTDHGIRTVERALGRGNLFAEENLSHLSAVQDALHAHTLLHRDVDYIVKHGAIESVDEFKGRVVLDRRWPAGLHTAIEAKERVALKTQGRILGSITLQNLITLYPRVSGMTGTAATQAEELSRLYGLQVRVIEPNRPVVRIDHPDLVFRTKTEKERAILDEIRLVHASGRPVLIGTASVQESERLSGHLRDMAHRVLNACNEEDESALIARAGERGAVTISTNMAGRGTDIRLGLGVADLGGLHVVGTNRHESRRIDFQLRGRAGRQGDPGSSRFIVSLEDDLVMRFAEDGAGRLPHTPESVQMITEGMNLDIRLFLGKYEGPVEGQRQLFQARRDSVLFDESTGDFERMAALRAMDDLWSDHLASVTELRSGVQWVSWGGRDPLFEYLKDVDRLFQEMMASLDDEVARRIEEARDSGVDPSQRGATWTYLTTDNPFGTLGERILKGFIRKAMSLVR
jgi:preprotein translocase subunit SecA